MKTTTLAAALAALLVSGCASMHGCDVSVGIAGPHMKCDQPPAPAPAPAPAAPAQPAS